MNKTRTKRRIFLTASLLLACASMNAGGGAPSDSLYRQVRLDEVVVSANRDEVKMKHSPRQVFLFPKPLIARANARSTADLLMEQGTLSVQKSQQGGGSPGIRGFEASRVLMVIDNVRMNNLIYRAGHLQNILTVDQFMLDKIEVLCGSSSLAYGSDALGGTIRFYTRNPEFSLRKEENLVKGNAVVRYGSVNNEATAHFDLNAGNDRFASLTSVTYSHFGDLKGGRNFNPFLPEGDSYIHRLLYAERTDGKDVAVQNGKKHLQIGSGYEQYDVMQKFFFKPAPGTSHLLNLQLSNSSDINRYDRLTETRKENPRYSEWYYGPQFRFMGSYEFRGDRKLGADQTSLILAYQKIKESRHSRSFNDNERSDRMEAADVITLASNWVKFVGRHTLHTGIDGTLSYVASTAHSENIQTGERSPLDTRYPDGGNHMHTVEAYLTHAWRVTDKVTFNDGARVGYSHVHSRFGNKQFFPLLDGSVVQNNFTYSLAASLNYLPVKSWKLALSLSTGYRVPNVDDLSKVFDSQAGMVVVPNPALRPEQTVTADINVTKYLGDRLVWENVFYGTYYFDAIGLAPATLNGQDSVLYDGERSRVYANKNSRRAYLCGYSTTFRAWFLRYFTADASFNYTYGRIVTGQGAPLDHIPPMFGRLGIGYRSKGDKLFIEFYALFNGRKKKELYNMDGEDNIKYATLKGEEGQGTPAWYTLNLKAGYQLRERLRLQAGVENILDTEYRIFASGINAPGRNLYLSVRASF